MPTPIFITMPIFATPITRLCIKSGSVMLTKISESAENIYREFTTTEASNQYMMFPFCGIRIDGEMTKTQDCINI